MIVHYRRDVLAAALGLAWLATGQAAERPALEAPVCDRPPALDGVLDEPAWSASRPIAAFYRLGSSDPAPGTQVRLMRDDTWLYLGAECRNPHMERVAQRTYAHDGAVQADDAIEILLRPSADPTVPIAHFLLNFANVGKEQRFLPGGVREIPWNPPWRTATRRQADGWTAEIAIPLYCLGTNDLGGLSLSLGRTLMKVDLDAYGAVQGETPVLSTLRPNARGGYHHPDNFIPVTGLAGVQPAIPFAPQITAAAIGGLRLDGGTNVYDLRLALEPATPATGAVAVRVFEDSGRGATLALERAADVAGPVNLVLDVPSGDWRERTVRVVLADPRDGNLLAARTADNAAALKVLRDTVVGRSYYTTETQAVLRVALGLPAAILGRATLALEAGGARLAERTGLEPDMTLNLPLATLPLGETPVTVRVLLDGRELASAVRPVVRRAPRPGREVKADVLTGALLKDGQPMFPVGLVGHALQMRLGVAGSTDDDDAMFRYLAEDIGINTVVRSSATNLPAFLRLAEKYGLAVVTWSYSHGCTKLGYPMSMLNRPADLPLAERLAVQRASYDQGAALREAETRLLAEHPNVIGYWNFDEPNLINPDERIAIAEWYWQDVRRLDPYRPLFLLYSKHIPHGDVWTRWSEVLGYDVYPRPGAPGMSGEPGLYTACYAWQLRERCRQDHKLMWFVPLSNVLDPGRSPVGMNKDHMLCQAYTAIIYGTRGLLYFCLSALSGQEGWDGLRAVCTQVKALTPALVNGDIPQTIAYPPDTFRPAEQAFPMVNAAVFRYPDGDVLLMAVNIMPHAVDARFRVGGLARGTRLFDRAGRSQPTALAVADGGFADRLEPYGVRAYRLRLEGAPAPVAVAVEWTARPEEQAPRVDLAAVVRQVMLGKNHMPNPCFRRQFIPGIPDFCRPYFCLSADPFFGQTNGAWRVDPAMPWNGHPSLRMFKRAIAAPGFKTRGMFLSFYPPPTDKPVPMTFSLYARSPAPKATLSITLAGTTTLGPFSNEWRRYHVTFPMNPGNGANLGARTIMMIPSAEAVIWINGLQLEAGNTPTDFQDDGVLEKKK